MICALVLVGSVLPEQSLSDLVSEQCRRAANAINSHTTRKSVNYLRLASAARFCSIVRQASASGARLRGVGFMVYRRRNRSEALRAA